MSYSENQALSFPSTMMLWDIAPGDGIVYSRIVARSAASAISACFTWLGFGASASGPRYGAFGPKYFSNAWPREFSCSGENFGLITLPRVMFGRKAFHSSAVLPRRFITVAKL